MSKERWNMKKRLKEKYLAYQIYLLDCLFQDIDDKIENPPLKFNLFLKRLYNVEKNGIMKKK